MTDVALREYLEAEIASLRREVLSWRESDKAAAEALAKELTRRLEVLNEFRAQMSDERADFATKAEVAAARSYTDIEVQRLKSSIWAFVSLAFTVGASLAAGASQLVF